MWQGSMVALVTPMLPDGSIDKPALARLIDWHCEQRTDAIVAIGTTGESPTVNFAEHAELIEYMVKCVDGRLPLIAGTGANATAEAIHLTEHAQQAGADACLSVTPYYNKPTQEGLYQHHKAIAEAVDIPQILYNVPGRTAVDLLPDTVLRLAQVPNVIGIKEATGDIERAKAILTAAPDGFGLYSGDDISARACMLAGAAGVISVTANVVPAAMHALCQACLAHDAERAAVIDQGLADLHSRLFIESNPIPVKWALHKMGLIAAGIRLPLTWLSSEHEATLRAALVSAGALAE